jgi:hypothetical protein
VLELEAYGKYSGGIDPVKNLRREDDLKHNPLEFPAMSSLLRRDMGYFKGVRRTE